jgi:hypothetical protein
METGLDHAVAGSGAPVARSLNERILAVMHAARKLAAQERRPRQERLSGLHNPWGPALPSVDPWQFLDLCEDAMVLDSVQQLIGPDIILWDSELYLDPADYRRFVQGGREGRYWPARPLAGAAALIACTGDVPRVNCVDAASIDMGQLDAFACASSPLYVIRYMRASSHFERDPHWPPNWIAMEEQPLVNYMSRPLWLVRGEDAAANDFVTGFAPSVPRWAGGQPFKEH